MISTYLFYCCIRSTAAVVAKAAPYIIRSIIVNNPQVLVLLLLCLCFRLLQIAVVVCFVVPQAGLPVACVKCECCCRRCCCCFIDVHMMSNKMMSCRFLTILQIRNTGTREKTTTFSSRIISAGTRQARGKDYSSVVHRILSAGHMELSYEYLMMRCTVSDVLKLCIVDGKKKKLVN